ncbi:MAG: KEOPS complex subunit Cgi121 [Candidatus Poseidoniaceae archaeon]|nr:KEOPS complex subunit Cgi121 [Candidatus Poseidoniaceae archaeon]
MEMPEFPCVKLDISNHSTNLIRDFIKHRDDESWLLMSYYAAQGQQQLWTAWLLAKRAFSNNKALARSLDAEFLRYIAGTHHVSDAFKKVGIKDHDDTAWLVFLPNHIVDLDEIKPSFSVDQFNVEVQSLVQMLGLKVIAGKPEIDLKGLKEMGIALPESKLNLIDSIIGHIISADLNS